MTKQEYLNKLAEELSGLPQDDIADRLDFYSEMIDDRTEDGVSEEEAVAMIGPVEEVAKQIIAEIPISKLVREKVKSKRKMGAGEIILLILGSPIWLSILIAAFAVLLAIYIVIWAVIISFWAVAVALPVGALAGAALGIVFICRGNALPGIALIGAAAVLSGLSIFWFFVCKAVSKGAVILTKKIASGIKSLFIKKEK